MSIQHSSGALARLTVPDVIEPPGLILQVLSIKPVESKNAQPEELLRYRVILFDGVNKTLGLLQGELADFVKSSRLIEGSFVRFGNISTVNLKGKCILVCFEGVPIEENAIPEAPTSFTANSMQDQTNSLGFAMQQQQNYNNNPGLSASYVQNQNAPSNFSHSASTENFTKILALNPFQSKWTIEATVSFKSELKTYKNAKGEGKLFNVQLLDDSSEIRATGFNEQVDKFYDMLEVGKSYKFSQLKIGPANKRFSSLQHDHELTFTAQSEVEPSMTKNPVPNLYNFVPISDVEALPKDSTIDLLAVIKEVCDLVTFNSPKTNKEFTKRDIVLVDTTMKSVRLTIWDKTASDFSAQVGNVVAGRSLRVAEFQGKTLNTSSSTLLNFNPDGEEAYGLLTWWNAQGRFANFTSLATPSGGSQGAIAELPDSPLRVIKDNPSFGMEKPETFNTTAMFCFIRESPTYPACPQQDCNKKVTNQDGQWYCAKCDKAFDMPEYRYIASACISDSLSSIWVQLFNEQASIVMGGIANDYETHKDNPEILAKIHSDAYYKPYKMTVLAKSDTYNETTRIRYSVRALKPLDHLERAQELCDAINQYA